MQHGYSCGLQAMEQACEDHGDGQNGSSTEGGISWSEQQENSSSSGVDAIGSAATQEEQQWSSWPTPESWGGDQEQQGSSCSWGGAAWGEEDSRKAEGECNGWGDACGWEASSFDSYHNESSQGTSSEQEQHSSSMEQQGNFGAALGGGVDEQCGGKGDQSSSEQQGWEVGLQMSGTSESSWASASGEVEVLGCAGGGLSCRASNQGRCAQRDCCSSDEQQEAQALPAAGTLRCQEHAEGMCLPPVTSTTGVSAGSKQVASSELGRDSGWEESCNNATEGWGSGEGRQDSCSKAADAVCADMGGDICKQWAAAEAEGGSGKEDHSCPSATSAQCEPLACTEASLICHAKLFAPAAAAEVTVVTGTAAAAAAGQELQASTGTSCLVGMAAPAASAEQCTGRDAAAQAAAGGAWISSWSAECEQRRKRLLEWVQAGRSSSTGMGSIQQQQQLLLLQDLVQDLYEHASYLGGRVLEAGSRVGWEVFTGDEGIAPFPPARAVDEGVEALEAIKAATAGVPIESGEGKEGGRRGCCNSDPGDEPKEEDEEHCGIVRVEIFLKGVARQQQGQQQRAGFAADAKQEVCQQPEAQAGARGRRNTAAAEGIAGEDGASQADVLKAGGDKGEGGVAGDVQEVLVVEEVEDEEGDCLGLRTPDQSDEEGTSPRGSSASSGKSVRLLSEACEGLARRIDDELVEAAAGAAAGPGGAEPAALAGLVELALRSAVAAAIVRGFAAASGSVIPDIAGSPSAAAAAGGAGGGAAAGGARGARNGHRRRTARGLPGTEDSGSNSLGSGTRGSSSSFADGGQLDLLHEDGKDLGSSGAPGFLPAETIRSSTRSSNCCASTHRCAEQQQKQLQSSQCVPSLWGGVMLGCLLLASTGAPVPERVTTAAAATSLSNSRRWKEEVQCAA